MRRTIKLLSVALVLALLCMPFFASADVLPTPWSDTTMKVWMVNTYTKADAAYNSGTGYLGGSTIVARYENNQFKISEHNTWSDLQPGANETTYTQLTDNTGVVGYGFYVKNEMSVDVGFRGHLYGGSHYYFGANTTYYQVVNGVATEVTTDANGGTILPSGFEGYILFPLSGFVDNWGASTPLASNQGSACFHFSNIVAETGKDVIIDDVFFYGTADMQSNYQIDFSQYTTEPATTETTTEPATTETTTEPAATEMVTVAPTEAPVDTADMATIAYAFTAIIGCGALLTFKKK